MTLEKKQSIRLGLFVFTGIVFLITALYLIGSKQNLFGANFSLYARFKNVNGLMKGNNVRFAGIDIGTVESVAILNDSTVEVRMVIDKELQNIIRANSVASIGTDGLMGNKLINILPVNKSAQLVENGDIINSESPIEMKDIIKTLNQTNENVLAISSNLRSVTNDFNTKNTLWTLLMDTVVAAHVKTSIVNLKLVSDNTLLATGDVRAITKGIKSGKGSLGALITDTSITANIRQTVVKINRISDSTAIISGNVSELLRNLKEGNGALGVLINDTTLAQNLNRSLHNINKSSKGLAENMEALKNTWPLKRYYKKKARRKK
jgi:phospholipid/cholesterol/gamma-HCH transport system substrate-binding protein